MDGAAIKTLRRLTGECKFRRIMAAEQRDEKQKRSVAAFVVALLISLVGMGFAAYLIDVHSAAYDSSAAPAGCDYSEEVNCTSVAMSEWSTILGVPTAAWGLLTYAAFFFISLAGVRRRVFPEGPGGILLLGALVATVFGIYLVWIMYSVVESWCINCLGLDVVHIGLVICGLFAVRGRGVVGAIRGDIKALTDNKPAAIAIVGGPLLAGVLVLAAYPIHDLSAAGNGDPDAPVGLPASGFVAPRDNLNLEGAPSRGPDDAEISIIEFSDYECPFCSAAHDEVRRIVDAHQERIRFVHFQHPLDQACNPLIRRPFHRHACFAAAAAICAQRQGRFWQLNDLLFEHGRELSESMLAGLIEEAGELNREELERCMRQDSTNERILHDLEQATLVPVEGTPVFIINDRVVSGFRPGLYRTILNELLENDGEWPERLRGEQPSPSKRAHDHQRDHQNDERPADR